jgi:transcriptional regulator NrdR family protein
LAWHRKKRSEIRSPVSRERLQSAITKAVKKADPKCEGFVGVIVQRQTPKAGFDADWAIKGVRFGKADRDTSSEALATIVERMQREFSLGVDVPGSPEKPGELKSNV